MRATSIVALALPLACLVGAAPPMHAAVFAPHAADDLAYWKDVFGVDE